MINKCCTLYFRLTCQKSAMRHIKNLSKCKFRQLSTYSQIFHIINLFLLQSSVSINGGLRLKTGPHLACFHWPVIISLLGVMENGSTAICWSIKSAMQLFTILLLRNWTTDTKNSQPTFTLSLYQATASEICHTCQRFGIRRLTGNLTITFHSLGFSSGWRIPH